MKYASLCILSYERPDFFYKSFKSLILNTTFPHERIIHDDGSKDFRMEEYIREQLRNVSYALLNKGQNRGIAKAMRSCIGVSSGEFIFKLDADLEYFPNWLEAIVSIIKNNGDVGACGLFNYRNYDPRDTRFEILEERKDCFIVTDFVNSGYGFKKGIFEQFGEAMGDDGWQQYIKSKGYKLAIPKKDVVYNFGFGANKSIYVKDGKVAVFHKEPRIF